MTYSIYGETMIRRAQDFATAAHHAVGQRRKFTNEPYIVHPRAVAAIIQALPYYTWEQVVWAWLHDVVEDTEITLDVITNAFGWEISQGLYYLTNVEREAGNRKQRHATNLARLAQAPARVQTVKVADIKDNTKNIAALGGSFAPVFLQEKLDVMAVLTKADPVLWSLTMDQIEKQQQEVMTRVKEA